MKRHPPIDDLLPQIRAAALKLRAQPTDDHSKALDRLLSQVAQRWHINVYGNINGWNRLIDTLDARHPLWRGYVPGQQKEAA